MTFFDELAPISQITSNIIELIQTKIPTLPSDPKEIAVTALSNGQTILRLACCYKLVKMLRDVIQPVNLTACTPLHADNFNLKLEEELTVSLDYDPKSITTIFSCAIAAIGLDAVRKFMASPSSVNPFTQCLRIVFRLMWFLRCRYLALNGIRTHNYLAVVNNSLRLGSFQDFSFSPYRAALYTALKIPEKVDLQFLSFLLPLRAISDSAQPSYDYFKSLLSPERKKTLEDLEIETQCFYDKKENPMFFSAPISIEHSLVAHLVYDLSDIPGDPCHFLLNYFLYELAPDRERDKFMKHFANACQKAAKLKFRNVRRRFDFDRRVIYEEEPKNMPEGQKSARNVPDPVAERQRKADFSLFSMFKPPRDFISDTKNIRMT